MSLPRAVFQGAWVFGVAALLALGCSSDDDGDGASAAGAGSSSVGGSGSAVGGSATAVGGSSTAGSSGASGASGRGGAGGSGNGGTTGSLGDACTTTSPVSCVDPSSVQLCRGGVYEKVTCDEVCTSLGFETGPCVSDPAPAGCECGDMSDVPCLRGVAALCACVSGTISPCTDDQRVQLYLGCFSEDPTFAAIACYGDHINEAETMVDCAAAAACFPDVTGEGGAGGSG
ncbi:MAG TPA: hypothetical protein VER33_07155 [Polyangiaceae bacterium]|nr:hypothetical protein [Polyangiaceae bacterium]